MYPMDVPHLHRFRTFNVLHLKVFVPHSKLEQLVAPFMFQLMKIAYEYSQWKNQSLIYIRKMKQEFITK